MEIHKLMLIFSLLLLSFFLGNQGVNGSSHRRRHGHRHDMKRYVYGFRPTKLFVFGDSYADTGNVNKLKGDSWKMPYGITYPGKPAGRFSNGRVLTDYLAEFLGIKSPVAYKWRDQMGKDGLKYGMNFAHGGTGVFNTLSPEPNMTTQISFFQNIIDNGVYTWQDLKTSLALVTNSGNDYGALLYRNNSFGALQSFIPQVVNQLAIDLKRIHDLGIKKVVVTSLEPLGCLPRTTVISSFKTCNSSENTAVMFHNLLLQQAVAKLNKGTNDSPFVILDLYGPFMSVFQNKGSKKFENPLKPCCVGISSEYSCGSVDTKGVKKYTVCEAPESAFFWDTVHPSQEGWHSVYNVLQPALQKLVY